MRKVTITEKAKSVLVFIGLLLAFKIAGTLNDPVSMIKSIERKYIPGDTFVNEETIHKKIRHLHDAMRRIGKREIKLHF